MSAQKPVSINFNKIFKKAVSGVTAVSKFMDEKLEPFFDSVIVSIQDELNVNFQTDERKQEFKTILKTNFEILFSGNTLKISKPKLACNSRGASAYTIFVKENRKNIMEENGLENKQSDFAALGRLLGQEWKKLDKEEQNEYHAKAASHNEESKGEKPAKEVKEKAVKEVKEKPVKEVKEKPVKEVKEKAVKEVKEKPVKEVKEKPVKEVKEKPVKEVKEKAVKEVKEKAVKKAEKKSEDKFEVGFDFVNEAPKSVSEEKEYWDSSKKIKGSDRWVQPDNHIIFEKDEEDEYKFIGLLVGKTMYIASETDDFPQSVKDWAESSEFIFENPGCSINFDDEDDE